MKKDLLIGLAWGGGIVLLALGATVARDQDLIDQDTVLRVVIGMNGIMLAYYGNRAPKAVAPSDHARQVARVTGWTLVVSGLVYAAFWAFAPIPVAVVGGCVAVAGGIAVSFGYCSRLRARARANAGGG